VAVLADALLDDPAWVHVVPDARQRRTALTALTGVAVRSAGEQVRVASSTDEGLLGVAVWQAPGRYPLGRGRALRTAAPAVPAMLRLGRRARDLQRLGAGLDAWFPDEPVRYLQALGVAPGAQGRGVGRRLVEDGLDVARTRHEPVYLETGKAENVGWYQDLGFTLLDPGRPVYPGGPVMWRMQWSGGARQR
jgi:GNAT superfamily N-acetyltransferase